jgi:hypothetical protein
MKPDSSKDKMDVDAGEHEDEGGAAAPAAPTEAPAGDKNAQDPASDGIKAADEAMDGAPKENADQDPWADNFPLQEQQGALTAAAALFLLCAMLANMCVCLPSLLVDDKVVAKQNHRTTSKRGKRGEPASRLARQRRSLLRRGPLPPATHLHPTTSSKVRARLPPRSFCCARCWPTCVCALRSCWWMTKWLLSRITERRARGARWRGDGRRGC